MTEVVAHKPYRQALHKRILKHPFTRNMVGLILSLVLRLLFLSCRKTRSIHPDSATFMRGEKAAIFCFWHGRMIFMPFFKPKERPSYALISSHGDGAFITAIMRWLGIAAIRGSSSRGGEKALAELYTQAHAADKNLSITPDGPRGPYQKASLGAVWLAAHTGLSIIPVSFSASRRTHAKSWDKFLMPLPFAHAHFIADAPITFSSTDAAILKEGRKTLESRLVQITEDADRIVDRISL